MRTRRQQRRRAKVQACRSETPDPFSRDNEDLVLFEERLMLDCPCCVERLWDLRNAEYERWYLRTRG